MAELMRTALILSNEGIATNIFRMTLQCPEIASQARPGQFVTLPPLDELTTWRRPFTVYGRDSERLTIVYRVVGRNTALYAQLTGGREISLIGPLGQPAVINPAVKEFWLVAGGCGLAPLRYILQRIEKTAPEAKVRVLAGFAAKNEVFGHDDIDASYGRGTFKVATDDGSYGFHGTVVDLLSQALRERDGENGDTLPKPEELAVYTCGPRRMMAAVAAIIVGRGSTCHALLEARMACGGLDACKGCVVKTTDGLKQVCQDGPVFDAAKIIWEE